MWRGGQGTPFLASPRAAFAATQPAAITGEEPSPTARRSWSHTGRRRGTSRDQPTALSEAQRRLSQLHGSDSRAAVCGPGCRSARVVRSVIDSARPSRAARESVFKNSTHRHPLALTLPLPPGLPGRRAHREQTKARLAWDTCPTQAENHTVRRLARRLYPVAARFVSRPRRAMPGTAVPPIGQRKSTPRSA